MRITSLRSIQAFVAQTAVESTKYTQPNEDLHYSAEGLMKTWPKRFSTLAFAQQYAGQPEKIANYVYANRNGNRNEASGEPDIFKLLAVNRLLAEQTILHLMIILHKTRN